jgi:hypothetical protein
MMAKENPKVAGNFMPYFWMGHIYKGLSWFMESDKGWSVDRKKPALEVTRTGDTVALRVNIVNKPFELKKTVTFVMGFQPTPVTPRLKGWRMISEHWKPKNIPGAVKMDLFAGSGTYGTAKEGAFGPVEDDYTIVKLTKRENREKPWRESFNAIQGFLQKHFSKLSDKAFKSRKTHCERGVRFSKNSDYTIAYVNGRASDLDMPAYQVYMDEWWCSSYRANMSDDYNNTCTKSNLDAACTIWGNLLKPEWTAYITTISVIGLSSIRRVVRPTNCRTAPFSRISTYSLCESSPNAQRQCYI